jgi:hypothetical protein
MSAQVVRGLFQRHICTRFRLPFQKPISASIVSRFRLHTIYPLHEIDLDVHWTDLQVVPFLSSIISAVSIFMMFHFPLALLNEINDEHRWHLL